MQSEKITALLTQEIIPTEKKGKEELKKIEKSIIL